jgi:hypothetical protein
LSERPNFIGSSADVLQSKIDHEMKRCTNK